MIRWIRMLFYVVKNYVFDRDTHAKQLLNHSRRLSDLEHEVRELRATLRSHTTVGADVGPIRGCQNFAVLVGRYRGVDHVEVVTLPTDEFGRLVMELKRLDRQGVVEFIDAPPSFKATFMRERNRP